MPEIVTQWLADDGDIPNNPDLALILYKGALEGDSDPERRFEALFASNGWGGTWVDGIFGYQHYHSTAHEALGIARGRAEVQFGGRNGPVIAVEAGDAVFLPAGTGHCRVSADGLSVVGAYPPGQDYDLRREGEVTDAIRRAIAAVPRPDRDPVLGADGPAAAQNR